MFHQLTKYLVQYKRVSIPSVGTIQLIQQPAQLNVAEKIILPPAFSAELRNEETVSQHQLNFLSAALREEKENVLQGLEEFGSRLNEKIAGDGFDWKGIGFLHRSAIDGNVSSTTLEPVAAERVLRQDAEHKVLVGDQQMTSSQIAGWKEEDGAAKESRRSLLVIIGWVLLALSILYIIFILYQGKFRIGATGSRQSPTSLVLPTFAAEKIG